MLDRVDAIGGIELQGMANAVAVVDVALKAATVSLIGYDASQGKGLVAVYLSGDVGAVNAALEATRDFSVREGIDICSLILPRPDSALLKLFNHYDQQISDGGSVCAVTLGDAGILAEESLTQSAHTSEGACVSSEAVEDGDEIDAVLLDDIQDPVEDAEQMLPDTAGMAGVTIKAEAELCNICHDPLCTRQKGEPRSRCIHNKKK